MQIGEPQRVYVVEPIREPVPRRAAAPDPRKPATAPPAEADRGLERADEPRRA